MDGSTLKKEEANPRRYRGPSRRNLKLLGVILVLFTIGFAFLPQFYPTPINEVFHLTTSQIRIEDGSDLVVYWHGNAHLHTRDYLTLSCGPQINEDDYMMRKNVTETDVEVNSVRFSALYMMRCNYSIAYFNYHSASKSYHSIAQVKLGMKESFNTPKHGHLALTTEQTSMVLMFNSASNRTPEIEYGPDSAHLIHHATGTSATYQATDMCQSPASTVSQHLFRDPGYMHTISMTNLTPQTVYFYRYGNSVDGWSEVQSFRSRPNDTMSTKFIAYADMGVDVAPAAESTAMNVYADVVHYGYDSFLLHFGDISYARGEGSVWDKFFHIIEPYATRIPYMVSVGNHEYDYTKGGERDPSRLLPTDSTTGFHPSWGNYGDDSLGECGVPMHHRWHVPATGNGLFWYGFDYGGVHVLQMSSEHNFTRGSAQYNWIQQDLANVNREKTPWIVITSHRMMYSTQRGIGNNQIVADHLREELEELFFNARVNLILEGHQHSYERTCPIYQRECMPDGKSAPVHVVVGTAGFDLSTEGFSNEYGNWSVAHADSYGHLRVATTSTTMHVEFVLNSNGKVYDEVMLTPY